MSFQRRAHRLWLPVTAALLPCVFIGALAWQWLGLEREAARYRGADAARADVAALQRDLIDSFSDLGQAVARALGAHERERTPFDPPPKLNPLISDAFLFVRNAPPANVTMRRSTDRAAFERLATHRL